MLAPQTGSRLLSLQLHAALHGDVRFTVSWFTTPAAVSLLQTPTSCALEVVCYVNLRQLKPNSITLDGSELVRSQIPLRYLVQTSFEPAPNQLRTS